jgi:formylglycine-generating enzyme required for sulfatase activity
MNNSKTSFLLLTAFFLIAGFTAFFWQSPSTEAQTKPLTYPEIITALNTKLPKQFFKTKADLLRWLNGEIKKRRVDKILTADREDDLRQAGATDELIDVIRQNSPLPPPVAEKTPTPVSTPPKIPTPSPTPTPDNSPPIKMEFVNISSGSFDMGSDNPDRPNEKPVHNVKIKGFQMQKTELTQFQWLELMKDIPTDCRGRLYGPHLFGKNKPMICASWDDIQEYIRRLNAKKDGFSYRLPTEAEWEYAARAGSAGEFIEDLDAVSWYEGNSKDTSHIVATKKPNAWGLYDMLGNVAEWVNDWYDEKYYEQSPKSNPPGPKTGTKKTLRAGSWNQGKAASRYAFRFSEAANYRNDYYGFRLVREKE